MLSSPFNFRNASMDLYLDHISRFRVQYYGCETLGVDYEKGFLKRLTLMCCFRSISSAVLNSVGNGILNGTYCKDVEVVLKKTVNERSLQILLIYNVKMELSTKPGF